MTVGNHLQKLRAFEAVVRNGSFRRAANELRVAQPALSRSIQTLEEAAGGKLLARTSKGVQLAPLGEILLVFTRRLISDLKDLEHKLKHSREAVAGRIHFGTYESIAIYFWPDLLKAFLRKHPAVQLALTTERSHVLYDQLRAGELDLVVAVEPPDASDLHIEVLFKDDFLAYVSTEVLNSAPFKIGERKKAPLRSEIWRRFPIISMQDARVSSDGITLHKLFEGLVQETLPPYSANSLETVRALTRSGIGIGILPRRVASQDVKSGKLAPIPWPFLDRKSPIGEHRICVAVPLGREGSPSYKAFIETFRSFLKTGKN